MNKLLLNLQLNSTRLENAIAKSKEMTPFCYKDKGTMATVGRNRAVVDLPFLKFSGIVAWFVWMFLHLMLLVDFRNKLIVFVNWSWSYFNYDKGLRLIVRKVKRPKDKMPDSMPSNNE